jgi:hypothetical protein
MNGLELNEKLPESFLKEAAKIGFEAGELRGCPKPPLHSQNEEARTEMERVVRYIKETVLPKVKGKASNPP